MCVTKLVVAAKVHLINNSVLKDVVMSLYERGNGLNLYIVCDCEMNTLNSTNFYL